MLGCAASLVTPRNALAGTESDSIRDRDDRALVTDSQPLRINVIHWGEWNRDCRWAQYLKDPRWKGRWPYYTSVDRENGTGIISGDNQEVMDQ
jgi:hypothetical protein